MRSLITTLVLLFGVTGVAAAQDAAQGSPLGLRPTLGVFNPMAPVTTIDNGIDPSVRLESAPAIGLEVDYVFHPMVGAYAGFSGAFSQLVHSSVFELSGPNPPNSRANILISTVGIILTPTLPLGVQPTVRLGGGTKWYDFDFPEFDSDNALDITGDIGLGLMVEQGSVSFVTEARWLPSMFDPDEMPIRFGTDDPAQQWQQDWLFQMGFRYSPLAR